MKQAKLHIPFAIPIFAVSALVLALALPAVASAAKVSFFLEKTGTGSGTVTSSPAGISCSSACFEDEAEYAEGTKVILTATASPGSYFEGWFGCDVEPIPTKCEITVNEETTVAAEFNEIEKYFLTVEKTGTGTGKVESTSPASPKIACGSECEKEFEEGTKVTLTASAGSDSIFEGWFGCDVEPTPTKCEVTIVGETFVEAEFNEIEKFPLTIEKLGPGQGTVTSSPAGISCGTACPVAEYGYFEGTKVTLTASAGPGSIFEGWTGCDAEPTATKCEVTVYGETYVEAEFGGSPISKFSLNVKMIGTGTGTVTCDGGACASSYDQGTKVTLVASAAPGSSFSGFSGGGCSGTGSCIVTITANTTVTATFTANSVPLILNPAPAPKPTPAPEVKAGTAKAAPTAKVKAGKAQLKLTCSGGPCKGTLKLTARIKQGEKLKSLVIGKASFSLANGASMTIKVRLSAAAKQALKGGKTLKAKVSGSGVASSTVKLKS